jgi:hypothetical protein
LRGRLPIVAGCAALSPFVFDGRHKFAGFYSPSAFNTPQTQEEIMSNNDVQLFDLQSDPEEMHNLVLEPEKNRATILRMNGLLNDLTAKEVGVMTVAFCHKKFGQNEPLPRRLRRRADRALCSPLVTMTRLVEGHAGASRRRFCRALPEQDLDARQHVDGPKPSLSR